MKSPELWLAIERLTPGQKQQLRGYVAWQCQSKRKHLPSLLKQVLAPSGSVERRRRIVQLDGRSASQLLELLESFIVHERVRKIPHERSLVLGSWYMEQGLEVRYRRSQRHMMAALSALPKHSVEWLLYNYRSAYLELHASSQEGPAPTDKLQAYMDALDRLYTAQKLWTSAEILARTRRSATPSHVPMLESLLEAKDLPMDSPLHRAYINLVRLQLDSKDSENLDEYIEHLPELGASMSTEAWRELHLHALNGATAQTNLGRTRYRTVYLDVLASMEQQGIHYDQHGRFEQWIFSNAILALLREKGPEQARSFMEAHGNALQAKEREPFVRLAAARIAFAGGNYDDVLAASVDLPFTDINHVVHLRIMAIKALAEIAMRGWKDSGLKERNASKRLDDGMKAFSNYLRYHKPELPERRYEGAMNLNRFLSRFWRLPIGSRRRPAKLLAEARNAVLAEKDWLLAYMQQD